jgi:hypothetical protein
MSKLANRIKIIFAIISIVMPILDDIFKLLDQYRDTETPSK